MPFLIVLYFVLAFFFNWWPFNNERWDAYVYPNANDLTVFDYQGRYESLDACRSASINRLRVMGKQLQGDYECGLNCQPSDYSNKLNVCEETRK
jgi:hypothetical protein